MRILNIGVPEGLLIVLLLFIVLGPDKIVSSARNLGVWLRKLTKSPFWNDFVSTRDEIRNLPKTLMQDVDLEEEIKILNQLKINDFNNIGNSENHAILKENETGDNVKE